MSADLRVVAVAASAWVGAAFGVVGNGRAFAGVVGSLAIAVFILRRRGWRSLASLLLIGVLVGGCLWVSSWSRIQANRTSVVHAVAAEQQLTRATVVITSDPVSVRDGTGAVTTSRGVRVMARLEVLTMASSQRQVRSPVMVFAPASWQDLIPGDVVQSLITWAPPRTPELAAVGSTTMAPTVVKSAPWIQRAAQTLRAGLRSACEGQSATTGAVLVPALVVGDTSTMPESLVDDLRLSGLAHLSAVSGANVAIVVGFVLLLAQLVRIRGRLLVIVGITTIAFFVILARPEPSVLRAAVMGTIALIAIVRGGMSRSLATLSAAVIVLLVIDPLLSVQLGFVLSVVATAGLIVVSPWFTQRLTRWMPLRVAQAISIAVGAQLVVSPVLAAISG
ncbi:MAG TPA: competence protein ComEC, partial [Actinobacteria bacterium]|nr:competence protein ComEC [Actinomycetota bacterium]